MDLPRDLHTAFRVVGLPWPDIRAAGFDGVLAESRDHPQARGLGDLVLVLQAMVGEEACWPPTLQDYTLM
jgi:hypothetical protein